MRAALAVLALLPVPAAAWQAVVETAPGGTLSVRGDTVGWDGYEDAGGFMVADVYFRQFDPGLTCESADRFEVDTVFGVFPGREVQLLVTIVASPGGWEVQNPAGFLNVTTRGNAAAVVVEAYDTATIEILRATCTGPERIDLELSYAFSGAPYTDKGPGFIDVRGNARVETAIRPESEY